MTPAKNQPFGVENPEIYQFECTGNTMHAHLGCIGIGASPNFEIVCHFDASRTDNRWTNEERVELAEYMISRWEAYKEKFTEE